MPECQTRPERVPPAPQQPPKGTWLAIASIGTAALALVMTEFVPVGLLPEMAKALSVTEGRAGLLVTVPGLVAAASAPLAPRVCAGIDRRSILLVLTVLLAASNAVVAVSTTFAAVLAGRVLLGIGVGGFWSIAGALGPRLVPGARSVRATGLILGGIAVGTVAGVPAGSFIGTMYGWRLAFWGTAATATMIVAAQWLVLPSIPAKPPTAGRSIRDIVKTKMVRTGLGATALSFVGHFGAYTYIAPLLMQQGGLAPRTVAALLVVFGIGTIIGNVAGAWLIGDDVEKALAAVASGVGASILILTLADGSSPVVTLCVLAWGLGYGALPLALQTWMFRACPDALETVTSLYVCVAQLSIGGGALLGGMVFDDFGPRAPFVIGGLAACSTGPLVLWAHVSPWRQTRSRLR